MSAFGQRLGLRLFLEGLEVPVISAQVQCTINSPAAASIQIVPGDGVLSLRPRTMVHLFFWDYTMDKAQSPESQDPMVISELFGISPEEAAEQLKSNPESFADRYDSDLRGYRLLFCGEVIGVSLTKTPAGRQAVLQCSDFSTYWDTTYQFFISYGPGGNFLGSSSGMWAGAGNMFDDITSGHVSVMNHYLQSTPKTPGLKNIKGLMGGIISLLEAMGGVPNHTSGVNDFFAIAELKNHILQQIVAERGDSTAQRLFSNKAFSAWLSGGMSSLGQLVTFRDMLKQLFKYIYYEVIPNPAAMYVAKDPGTTKKVKSFSSNEIPDEVVTIIESMMGRVKGYQTFVYVLPAAVGQDLEWGISLSKEIMELLQKYGEWDSAESAESAESALARARLTGSFLVTGHADSAATNVALASAKKEFDAKANEAALLKAKSTGSFFVPGGSTVSSDVETPAVVRKKLPEKTRAFLELANQQTKKIKLVPVSAAFRPAATTPEDIAKASASGSFIVPVAAAGTPRSFQDNRATWVLIYNSLKSALQGNSKFVGWKEVVDDPGGLDRLHTQIFRPDCFFAAAPCCNVLFPDQYTQFNFSRNFLQECTRLRLSIDLNFGINKGCYGLLGTYLYAPALSQIQEFSSGQQNVGLRTLLPWEKYSGIMPKFESMHEVNYVAGRSEKNLKFLAGGEKTGAAVNYGQRVANFNYMKYRFAARSCEVSAKFNPFLVCGFPAVIIDKPFILTEEEVTAVRNKVGEDLSDDMSEFVRTAARYVGAPTHYIGMIASLSHSISQDGSGTSIAMTHARSHRVTDDDFLDIFSKEITANVAHTLQSTVLDAETLLRKGNWKLLRFLRDATPQDLDKQAIAEESNDLLDEYDAADNVPLEVRPGAAPPQLDLESTGPVFGSLLSGQTKVAPELYAKLPSGRLTESDGAFPIRGRVTPVDLPNNQGKILVPDPGGKLVPGKNKGPLGGTVAFIACDTDQAMAVVGRNVSKKVNLRKPIIVGSGVVTDFVKDAQGNTTLNGNVVSSKDVVYFWKRVTIYEKIKKNRKNVVKLLPVEEGMRPSWFSPFYSNWLIGKKIYTPFFGCGSIVDQALFEAITPVKSSSGNLTDEQRKQSVAFGTSREKQKAMLEQVEAAGNDKEKISTIIDQALADRNSDVPDIESSVDVLAYLYGEVRRLGLDVNKFINDYTRRPIATLEEILGSADLEYEELFTSLKLVSGTPGFHSTAIADTDQLRGLLDKPDEIKVHYGHKGEGKPLKISPDLDPRPGRRERVVEYLAEITAVRGTLGVGVQG